MVENFARLFYFLERKKFVGKLQRNQTENALNLYIMKERNGKKKEKRNNLDIFRIIIWRIKNVISIFLYYYMCRKKNYEKLFVSLHRENFSE